MSSHASPPQRQEVRTFWTGPGLSYYEQLSLKSVVASGARVLVYTYDKDLVVPEGVEVADADEILSGPVHQFRHASGDKSFALHSDLFRYLAVYKFGGWYIDLDIIFLGQQLPESKTYIAAERWDSVNAAVMKFPEKSPVMAGAIEEAWRLLPQAGMAATDAARVVIGPALFTRLVSEYALDHLVLPKSRAYEIPHAEVLAFFDPARCDSVKERLAGSDFTHLWNEAWRLYRIPKNYGPPEGSYLDVLFRRFGIDVPARARLSFEAIEAWVREYRVLEELKSKLAIDKIRYDTLDHLARSIQVNGWQPGMRLFHEVEDKPQAAAQHTIAREPQTVRTFWHGTAMGPYQLMCLRSFVDRGHRVEVFSYNSDLRLPDWIEVKSAESIMGRERILRSLSENGPVAIHANLFRYALLHQLGGWWIDPDTLLLTPDLPQDDVFIAGPDIFGRPPTGALKFFAGHPMLADAIARTEALGDSLEGWERSGATLMGTLLDIHQFGDFRNSQSLGPLSWFDVPDLFDPACSEELNRKCNDFRFFQIHDEVWRRAGVPHNLAPPEGSFLASLLAKHETDARFPARMAFNEVNRWLAHMYQCVRQGQT